ncbi:MAG: hypothetical protein ACI30R_06300 [Sodaliphilus sp.]
MKKIYLFLLSMVLCSVAALAQTTIVVNLDSPERAYVEVNYAEVSGLVAGDNTIEVPQYGSVYIKSRDGYILNSVVRKSTGASEYISNMTQCYIYVSAEDTWTVTSASLESVRTAKCHVKADKANKVQVMRSTTYTNVSLTDGEWVEVPFVPEKETPLQIGPAVYGDVLNKVVLNGNELIPSGSNYVANVADGDSLEIFAEFEDVDYKVQFAYSSEDIKSVVTGVTVDGVAVTNYNDADFTVQAGKKLAINFDNTNFSVDTLKVNGVQNYVSNRFEQVIKEDTKFEIVAHRYAQLSATLNIDHADRVTVARGYSYSTDYITNLVDGANTITVPETNKAIYVKAVSGAVIDSLNVNGVAQSVDYAGGYSINVEEGMVINVYTSTIERNATLRVYMSVDPSSLTYFSMTRADRSAVTLTQGWNEVKFNETIADDNPFSWSWYDSSQSTQCGIVKLNGVDLAPQYAGSVSYQASFKDGDELKIYPSTTEEPSGINDVEVVTNAKVKGVFNIAGQQLNTTELPAGIYIVNGEKVVIR